MRSINTIMESMEQFIIDKGLNIDVSEGEPLHDTVIQAPANEFAKLYSEILATSRAQSIETANEPGLERIGDNFNLTQRQAKRSIVPLTFVKRNEPMSDIVIPAGTLAGTRSATGTSGIEFATIRQATMFAGISTAYYNAEFNHYEITVMGEATTPGVVGNVGPRTIVMLSAPAVGVDGVYNAQAARGGRDFETTSLFRNRISSKLRGMALGNADGILSEVMRFNSVDDAVVLGHGESPRDIVGAIDVLIKGTQVGFREDVFTTVEDTFDDIVLRRQPILLDGVLSVTSAGKGVMNPGDYTLVKDTGAYGGSVSGFDKISWATVPPSLEDDGSIVVRYNYNVLVDNLQKFFQDPAHSLLNTDVLVKWAFEIPIDINFTIKLRGGSDEDSTIDLIKNSMARFLNTLIIGEPVRQADLVRIILSIDGVRDVLLPFTLFRSSDSTIVPNAFNNLEIPSNSYAIMGDAEIGVQKT